MTTIFDWNDERDQDNQRKHGVAFDTAQYAFFDEHRIIFKDEKHSQTEDRWFCLGKVGDDVLTVRFMHRDGTVRIFGAAKWRKWRKFYEQENARR
jgi:uncharacterized protein